MRKNSNISRILMYGTLLIAMGAVYFALAALDTSPPETSSGLYHESLASSRNNTASLLDSRQSAIDSFSRAPVLDVPGTVTRFALPNESDNFQYASNTINSDIRNFWTYRSMLEFSSGYINKDISAFLDEADVLYENRNLEMTAYSEIIAHQQQAATGTDNLRVLVFTKLHDSVSRGIITYRGHGQENIGLHDYKMRLYKIELDSIDKRIDRTEAEFDTTLSSGLERIELRYESLLASLQERSLASRDTVGTDQAGTPRVYGFVGNMIARLNNIDPAIQGETAFLPPGQFPVFRSFDWLETESGRLELFRDSVLEE